MMSNSLNNRDGDGKEIYNQLFIYFLKCSVLLLMTTLFTSVIDNIKRLFKRLVTTISKKFMKTTCIILQGNEEIAGTSSHFHFCKKMNGVGYYMKNNNISNSIRMTDDNDFVLEECDKLKIAENINIDVCITNYTGQKAFGGERHASNFSYRGISYTYRIYSNKLNYNELEKFLNKLGSEYENYIKTRNDGKLCHFVYQKSFDGDDLAFGRTIIMDTNDEYFGSYETFDNIFSEHRDKITREINKLSDKEYYRRNGLKRKKGFLFYGVPGCGKTSFVMAIAHMTKRHIIEVPLSRVKTNSDFEEILAVERIRGFNISRDNSIILFDEIDVGLEALKKREDVTVNKNNDDEDDDYEGRRKSKKRNINISDDNKLSLDTLLSRLDGIGNYNGMIFIATTNCIDKLDTALYRHGRLDPYHFDYCRKVDIIDMIEKYYMVELDDKVKENLPGRENKISPATMKKYLIEYDNMDDLLKLMSKTRG